MPKSDNGTVRRLWALEGGTLSEDRSNLVVGEKGPVTVPCPCFLIEHARGLVLLDTGLVPAAAADARAVYGDMADELQISLTREQCVDHQLGALGFKPDDIDHVIMSHLHWDHTGGMFLFPRAQFHVMSGELQYAYWPLPAGPLYRREDIEPTRGFNWNQIEAPELDLFGDGSIVIIHLPGHTPGNASVLVRLPTETIILGADTAHLRSGYLADRPMPSDWNTLESVRSIRRLRALTQSLGARLWLLHDPEDWAENKHAPEVYS
ncbi:MAG: N-acyl homoserine lactonase family protein [Janthinobacterium lividum]